MSHSIPVLNVTLTLFIMQPSTEVAEENAVKNAHGMRSTEPYSMSMNAMVLKLKRSIMTKGRTTTATNMAACSKVLRSAFY
uniref:Secreted protein n=1 Tax=Echinococcus granulosus TaxID=6210 RepID=A0A068X2L7_ECHGR|nr:hypothetical protein EgrG_002054300 [Echinococcus granulosus]